LNAIMGFSDIMRQRLFGPMSDRYAEYADLVHDAGAHLLELINDVLDMSKIEAERFELAREVFDARDAVSAVVRLMRGQAERAGVQLRGVLPPEPLQVDADRRAVKQIALNLVSNALKFTPKGGTVTVSLRPDGDNAVIAVTDTGIGIPAVELSQLSQRFFRASTATRNAVPGVGLGLTITKAIVTAHGGRLDIASEEGIGTSISIVLPVDTPRPVTEAIPRAEVAP